ncbi:MAG TPA: hypothetical protein VMW16_14335 [Sedimentisphaerales bacterium]|nr:hypothetical protein [Sedimentisphaerales bacterium]
MNKRLLFILLFGLGLCLSGCSCHTWTSFWGGDPEKECMDHWHWGQKTAAAPAPVRPVAVNPCAAPTMLKSTQTAEMGASAVRLEKMVPEEVRVGEAFDYGIKVTNLTDTALANVMVKDCVPENLKIRSSMPQITEMKGGDVHWALGTLEPRGSKMITVNAVAEGKGSISSCAEVFYESPICARINIVEPQLQLAKYAPADTLACERIPVRYVLTNTGTGYACDITVKDKLQEGLMTAEGKSELMFTLDSLGPGQSREFEAMLDARKCGKYASKAIATSRSGGQVESDLRTTNVREPVLAINQSCPADQYIGRPLTYDITVTNKGDAVAKDTIIQASVPEGIKFHSATAGGQFSSASPGKVVWNVGSLEPSASMKVSMTFMGDRAGSIQTTAMAKAYCADDASTSCRTMVSGIPAILLEVIDVSDPIEVGQSEMYIITVTNQGSAPDTNIRVSCMLEENMQYVSSSGPTTGLVEGNKVTFGALASLAPKAQAKWQVNVKALRSGDVRFKTVITSDQLSRTVEETESTNFYE